MSTSTLFQVGGPVTEKFFYDRDEILEELRSSLIKKRSYIGFALYGIRRTGKTSILKEFKRRTKEEKDVVVVYVDVSGIHPFNIENLYDTVFSRTIEALNKKGRLPVKTNVINALRGSLTSLVNVIRTAEVDISIKDYLDLKVKLKEGKADLQQLLEKSFNSLEKLSEKTNTRIILVLDEFPFIEDFGEKNIVWSIRSVVQNWKNACLIVSGSSVSMMKEMTSVKTSPFYMLLQIREVNPFDEKTSFEMLKERFNRINIKINDDACELAFKLTSGFPFYLQWLGERVHDMIIISKKKTLDKELIRRAYGKILKEGEVIFAADIEKLSNGERDVLIEMGASKIFNVSEIAKVLEKRTATTAKMIERLIEKGYLKRMDKGIYNFNDPLLMSWIEYKYE